MKPIAGVQYPAMACCHTMDDEQICVLQHGHWGEHAYKKSECNHTPQPTEYKEWHSWAKQKNKTHRQVRCPHCGLWAIWVPKLHSVRYI